jgi:hypothetical protein
LIYEKIVLDINSFNLGAFLFSIYYLVGFAVLSLVLLMIIKSIKNNPHRFDTKYCLLLSLTISSFLGFLALSILNLVSIYTINALNNFLYSFYRFQLPGLIFFLLSAIFFILFYLRLRYRKTLHTP